MGNRRMEDMYKIYRSLGKEELFHGEYDSYIKAMREACYLVKAGLSKKVEVNTIHDIKTVVLGKDKRVYISGKPL